MRLAEQNGLRGISDLAEVLGVSYLGLVSLDAPGLNELLNGVPFHHLKNGYKLTKGRYVLRRYGWGKESRVCPECVKEKLEQPACFNSAIPTLCPRHFCLPLDFCPRCTDPLTYLRMSITHCACGYALRDAHADEAPQWLSGFYGIFAPWHLSRQGDINEVLATSQRDWDAAKGTLWLLNGLSVANRAGYLTSANFPALARYVSAWPRSFDRTISSHLSGPNLQKKVEIVRKLAGQSPILRQTLEGSRALAATARMSGASSKTDDGKVSVNALRQLAKIDAAAAAEFLTVNSANIVSAGIDVLSSKHLDRTKFDELKDFFDRTIDVHEAAERLECEVPLLRALAQCGLIPTKRLEVKPRSPRFVSVEIMQWLRSLQAFVHNSSKTSSHWVALAHLPVRTNGGEIRKSWRTLMERLVAGRVELRSEAVVLKISTIRIRAEDAISCGYRRCDIEQLVGS